MGNFFEDFADALTGSARRKQRERLFSEIDAAIAASRERATTQLGRTFKAQQGSALANLVARGFGGSQAARTRTLATLGSAEASALGDIETQLLGAQRQARLGVEQALPEGVNPLFSLIGAGLGSLIAPGFGTFLGGLLGGGASGFDFDLGNLFGGGGGFDITQPGTFVEGDVEIGQPVKL